MNDKKNYELISLGDTATDIFLGLERANVTCKSEDCLLCFPYAGKIAAESVEEIDAVGNAANVAIGASRLGVKTAIWTVVGNDTNGKQAREVFAKEKVATNYIVTDDEKGTNYSVILNYQGERTILVYHNDRDYVLPELADTKWVYLTSMGHSWNNMANQLLEFLDHNETKFAFSPGTHQVKSGLSKLLPFIQKASFFSVNLEEAQKILDKKGKPEFLLEEFQKLGPDTVVITDGRNGTYACEGKDRWHMPIYPDSGPVVDRTGCGDSFTSAVLTALIQGQSIFEAIQWGSANARSVVQFVGARAGLLDKTKIQQTIKEFTQYKPEKI